MSGDPQWPDWASRELPRTWPDDLTPRRPLELCRALVRAARRPRARVTLPEALAESGRIPRYALQEFHNLPNGNYSRHVTRGYSNGFDRVMLGVMTSRRRALAEALEGCRSVLDLGCGAGRTAGAILEHGVPEVWGLDPSPYLLQHAARDHPSVRFVQGVAEATGFRDERFEGVSACFLFHELPPRITREVLSECRRILQPKGKLAIVEPGREQWETSSWQLLRGHGWRGVYYRALARRLYEPFLEAFHALDFADLLSRSGFVEIREEPQFPTVRWTAVRG